MNKYMNIKNIIIFVLLIGCLTFGYINLFRGDKLYEYKVEELKKENEALKKQKLAIDEENKTLKVEFANLKLVEDELKNPLELQKERWDICLEEGGKNLDAKKEIQKRIIG
jgi:regulator of replication initiation timing